MANKLFAAFSYSTMVLNRILAWVDFAIHYVSGYLFYYLLGGMKPQYHTRPAKLRNGDMYSPSVVITGASEGIGVATATHLAANGYTVFATVKDESEIPKVKEAAHQKSKSKSMGGKPLKGSIHPMVMDVLSEESVSAAVKHIQAELDGSSKNPLVGVINNAGYCMISPMEHTPDKAVRDIFELDFWAYIRVIRAFLPMIKQDRGRIINVCSYGAYINPPMWAPYSAIKAAIEGMTRSWRFEMSPFGVGMATVRPGYTRTNGIGPKISKAWEAYFDNIPNGAVGVTSLGDVIKEDLAMSTGDENVYRPMMEKWAKLLIAAADGLAETAEAVAYTIHDAMTDPFLQPYYTVGYDALLGQMTRDLTPESVYELGMRKAFG